MKAGLMLIVSSAVLVVAFSLTCCSDAEDFRKKAQDYMNANEPRKAEQTLRDGLAKFPDNANLQIELLQLYERTERWGDLDAYLELGHFPKNVNSFISDFHTALARHYFSIKDWTKSAAQFEKAGRKIQAVLPEGICSIGAREAAESYRNAAAAYVQNNNTTKVKQALETLQSIADRYGCKADEIKGIAEVSGWLKWL